MAGKRGRSPKVPRAVCLLLCDVADVRGSPHAVLGRLSLPADVQLDVLDMVAVDARTAASLRKLLREVRDDGLGATSSPGNGGSGPGPQQAGLPG